MAKRHKKKYEKTRDSQAQSLFDSILKTSKQSDALVDNITTFISTRELSPRIENVALREVFKTVKDEFSPQLSSRGITWSEPESPPTIRVDMLSLLRVLRNFVDNSLKYGGESLATIQIGYYDAGDRHSISVKDDGIGLKEQDIAKVFGLFIRNESSRGIAGTGLGLAIVKEIAEQFRGAVWVESTYGNGASFSISISKDL